MHFHTTTKNIDKTRYKGEFTLPKVIAGVPGRAEVPRHFARIQYSLNKNAPKGETVLALGTYLALCWYPVASSPQFTIGKGP